MHMFTEKETAYLQQHRIEADPRVVTVLYLAHCTREKGLFDTVAGVELANRELRERKAPVSLRLLVTGNTPGVAMKSQPFRVRGKIMHRPGTIIGKALESLSGGEGTILVLLSLQ